MYIYVCVQSEQQLSTPPPKHIYTNPYIDTFTWQMELDSEIESIDTADIAFDAISFSWAVDSAIASRTPSNLGASPVHSFASLVDSAIRSRTPSNLGAPRVHSSALAVDMRTIAARLSQGVSKATGYGVHGPQLLTGVHGFQLFIRAELVAATNNFSIDNKIGAGSFGVVYRGKLVDGRQVAIKRRESSKTNEFPEEESAFASQLVLSRLHHKHLIGLLGFCENKYERLLVYEYMENGTLHDHLHRGRSSSVFSQWRNRIKVALDASRGIEYLHNYAVPSIIHRNIKSSNILLDATWTARVSGFGISLMVPEPDGEYDELVMGTLGYLAPEYFSRGVVTVKSDMYSFGVVLLELLTGKKAALNSGEDGGTPLSVVNFAVPAILAGDLVKILDPRVGPPDVNEAEAVELVASTAIHCVNLEGKDRPTIADVVVNLKRALDNCDSSPYDSISSSTICDPYDGISSGNI